MWWVIVLAVVMAQNLKGGISHVLQIYLIPMRVWFPIMIFWFLFSPGVDSWISNHYLIATFSLLCSVLFLFHFKNVHRGSGSFHRPSLASVWLRCGREPVIYGQLDGFLWSQQCVLEEWRKRGKRLAGCLNAWLWMSVSAVI